MADLLERLRSVVGNRYRVERELERSGLALACVGHDQMLGRPVFFKVLHPNLAASLDAKRFLREIRIAARLIHPNILAPYDSGDADGLLYYVVPFVEADTLRQLLNRKKRLPVEEAVEIACHVAAALQDGHEQDVVHRDIRPENIFLPVGQAVVAEYGVARAVRLAAGEGLTETVLSPGRPYYMSPERLLGDEVDARSDLYSFGATLFEMVTGEKPFEGETAQQIVARHISQPVRKPRDVEPTVPAWLSNAIVRCLEKTPSDRFQSAAELLRALEAGGAAEPAAAEPATELRATEEPAAEMPAGEKPAGEEIAVEQFGVEEPTAEEPALGDIGVGDIVQGASWDFDELLQPEVEAPPQTVYNLYDDEESPPETGPGAPPQAEEPSPPPPQPIPSPSGGITRGGDLIPGAWFEPGQAGPGAKPGPQLDEAGTDGEVGAPEDETTEPEMPAVAGEPPGLAPLKPATKTSRIPPWLLRMYDWGPELVVRLARQRQTWNYVARGALALVVVMLVWVGIKSMFFRAPTAQYHVLRNALVEPVQILVDGQMVYTLEAGQQDSIILPRGRSVQLAWRLVRPRQGREQMGEVFEVVLPSGEERGEDARSVITAVDSSRAMFAPRITNRTNLRLVALINYGTTVELRCNCEIPPNSENVQIGYYPLLEGSTIRFFDARRAYSGRFQEITGLVTRVDTLSGAIGITVERF
ncbi:MAG: protein kinase [Gemmatimonadota bacterium]|nr:MAG: protein kinase [Gemmatimonadota bacterium]